MGDVLKEVFFIRHAKSAWENPSLSDLERPLNDRGHLIAPKMASYIYHNYKLEHVKIISSPAIRAITTASYFANTFGITSEAITQDPDLYYGNELDYLKCLQIVDMSINIALIFGHNPTIESLVGKLKFGYHGPVPTCAIFHCLCKSDNWTIKKFSDLKLEKYYFPKIILAR